MDVGAETGPEGGGGACDETKGEFALEHEDSAAEEGAVGEEAEDERGGDLVGGVGDADVEVGEGGFDEVADYDFEFALFWSVRSQSRLSIRRSNED